ncbi:MAG: hypothetical protein ACRBCL_10785 [Maritimibacter sp.]
MTRAYAQIDQRPTSAAKRIRWHERPQGRYKLLLAYLGHGRAPETPQARAMAGL